MDLWWCSAAELSHGDVYPSWDITRGELAGNPQKPPSKIREDYGHVEVVVAGTLDWPVDKVIRRDALAAWRESLT